VHETKKELKKEMLHKRNKTDTQMGVYFAKAYAIVVRQNDSS
jgi:hypothetical protein